MDYADLIYRLWRLKVVVVVIVLLGVLIGLLSFYRLTSSPFGLHSKTTRSANAGVDVLVQANQSPTALSDTGFTTVLNRSRLLVAVLVSQPVRNLIASQAAIPASQLSVDTTSTDATSGKTTSTTANKPVETPARVVFGAQAGLPLISVRAYASTGKLAERLANAGVAAARQYTEKIQSNPPVPARKRLTLQPLDQPRAVVTKAGPTKKSAIFAGVGVGALLIVLLLVVDVGLMHPPVRAQERMTV